MVRVRLATLAGCGLVVATLTNGGCGAATSPGSRAEDSEAGGGPGSSSGSSGSSEGGSPGDLDAGPDADVPEVFSPSAVGKIELSQLFPLSLHSSAELSASFGPPGVDPCALKVVAGCVLYGCMPGSVGFPGDSAGTLTVAGSGGAFSGPVLVPFVTSGYETSLPAPTPVSAGQSLTVSASGATVPAFSPQDVVMPSLPVLTAPATPLRISLSSDLAVAWTGGQQGATFRFAIYTGPAVYVSCNWDAGAARATVSRAVLVGLDANSSAGVLFGQYATTDFTAGSYAVKLDALAATSVGAETE